MTDETNAADHPSWCEPQECDSAITEFHLFEGPRAHRSRLVSTSPGVRRRHELDVQLVRFFEDSLGPDYIRLQFGDVEGRQSFHIFPDQAQNLVDELTDLLAAAGYTRKQPS